MTLKICGPSESQDRNKIRATHRLPRRAIQSRRSIFQPGCRRSIFQRLAVDFMFDNFERNQTHLWPREEDTRGARHEIQVISDDGDLLKSLDIREIIKEAGLKFLGRRVDVQV
jgi:hypothetical protein